MMELQINIGTDAAGELANRLMTLWPDREVKTENGSLSLYLPVNELIDYNLSLIEEVLQKIENHRNLDTIDVISRNISGPDSAPAVVSIGDFLIRHPLVQVDPQPGQTVITLDPRSAFGTGGHPSSVLTLNALNEFFNPPPGAPSHEGAAVLDVGTGSGVLALAAASQGAGSVLAIDPSDRAVEAARENVVLNGVESKVEIVQTTADQVTGRFDLILANLTPSVLIRAAKKLAPLLARDGTMIVAGFADAQTPQIVKVTTKLGLCCTKSYSREGWTALSLSR